MVWQAALESWFPTVTGAVIAPENLSSPAGMSDSRGVESFAVAAVPAPQPVKVAKSATTRNVPSILAEPMQ